MGQICYLIYIDRYREGQKVENRKLSCAAKKKKKKKDFSFNFRQNLSPWLIIGAGNSSNIKLLCHIGLDSVQNNKYSTCRHRCDVIAGKMKTSYF